MAAKIIAVPVAENQFAVLVHEVEKLIDVIAEHGPQGVFSEDRQQLSGSFVPDGGHLFERAKHQVVHGFHRLARADQGPQRAVAMAAFAALVNQHDLGHLH